ncbi:alpha,alpha-trehalose-phosphate synthase (UDP-forming) [Pigmentiphaga sp.]|uniref:alpha,alpha-trehalose-phosphate synthase (UDP-forming) n=1 Tax=Pigmentiphaga sp. TaxID=1977564 RepID=UPI00128E1002|nr:alpha,alpha-trehalose-phosphate synthase (UDP-forming) [Pigmentiphaga sp.]MPS28689.1 alpha,alpha-trehalose-phosphate synthase (UDP-forming) [Alcaligenaceae bacterium SAGV5]MPS53109.1 alpha,alpha-trehalose-phosphate synthase (UDP-forming) [Alcaligenaceae bacterium SAGV3]MPT57688.1 alpha,alpha-trehalose-phosphate synthase (UDP-forming) [Alcaligenaceae bacterium]
MGRLVIVSNRVASAAEGRSSAGGLAVGVLDALKRQEGLWFGWNGKIEEAEKAEVVVHRIGRIDCATTGLSRSEYDLYYRGFANGTLWPTFHYRIDLSRYDAREYAGYLAVNERLAGLLKELVVEDDRLWIHDYHLIPFARACRRLGLRNRIGFFLHTPFPPEGILRTIPPHRDLAEALCEYDLIGFQTRGDAQAFRDYAQRRLGLPREGDSLRGPSGTVRVGHYPIGILPDDVQNKSKARSRSKLVGTLKQGLQERKLIISVDRLDYSKGMVERFNAFERLLESRPSYRGHVSFLQIAPPSRSDVEGYRPIRRQLETTAGHINARWTELSWTPIRYMNRAYERAALLSFFRASQVGFVTPLRDGMNLVAKEYVAAQEPEDPGVLVLSEFAGAADELADGAIIVNPYDIDAMACALDRALAMPFEERRERHGHMMQRLKDNDIKQWRDHFLADL